MGKDSYMTEAPLKERVEADHLKTATQLKAEHAKEDAALKAEEAQKLAALKAEHAKTPGKTGFLAKLTGHQDPVKKAETEQLKAEIARAEETTKAEHDFENAELNARKRKENATIDAVDSMGSNTRVNTGAGYGANTHHHGTNTGSTHQHGLNNEHGANAGLAHGNIDKAYNHATGARGLAALQDNLHHGNDHHHSGPDNGLHHENDHHHSAGRTETGHHIDGAHNHSGMGGNTGMGNTGMGMGNAGFQGQGIGHQPHMATQAVGAVPMMAAAPMMAAPVAATPFVASTAPVVMAPGHNNTRY
jgi:hypothetical protein